MALRNRVSQKNNSRKFSSSRRRMTYYLWITKPNKSSQIAIPEYHCFEYLNKKTA